MSFHTVQSDKSMQSLKGKLILDGGKLAGSEFHRAVVLICHHDPAGAFGLVLNRPSGHKVSEVLTEPLPDPVKDLSLYLGGPVQPQAFSCLIRKSTNDEVTEATVMPGLRIAHTLDGLAELSREFPAPAQLKFFAGYAGWGATQLDNEMKQAAWLTYPASMKLVFYSPPEELWKLILLNMGPTYRLLAETPDDMSRN
jgi:putative transcriptional regulator